MVHLSLMLLFCLALAIFAVQNTATVQLQFLIWKTQTFPLSILVISSSMVGVLLAFLLSIPTHSDRKRKLKQRERELDELRDVIGKH